MSKLIFREYIGVNQSSTSLTGFPTEIINTKNFEFHFILGFASEEYDKNGKGKGIFKETWDVDYFGPEKVKILKENNPNVKVVISIGGRDVKTPFDPVEEYSWDRKAVKSLKELIGKYKNDSGNMIDGIDINYETIKTNNDLFVKCISRVITQLKNDLGLNINVVSIALSEKNEPYYRTLYYANKDNINWVDYQFYDQEKLVSSAEAFIEIYNNLIKDYGPDKVLPGISTDPIDTKNVKITQHNFIDGCVKLLHSSKLPGVFLWNANDSANPSEGENEPYALEYTLQDALTI
ncbi:chitinase 2-like [Vicia villosa]|uniref:chitinase 2-like n=1 Tax=Vicia villosa TaxID=3911 RepID=UPI00273C4DFF|nr:chitinase 2-like [Vicia villosa]